MIKLEGYKSDQSVLFIAYNNIIVTFQVWLWFHHHHNARDVLSFMSDEQVRNLCGVCNFNNFTIFVVTVIMR